MNERLRYPPSNITGELGSWLQEVWRAVNAIPAMSMFSGTFPSNVTGVAGDIAVNVGVSSTASKIFIHYGSRSIPESTSWRTIG